VLSGLTEFERDLIRARTGEGPAHAKARDVRLRHPLEPTPPQKRKALARRESGELVSEIVRSYNVSHSTISRFMP
jgi:DNA invertase Pin-like site-specific DNA recombinase